MNSEFFDALDALEREKGIPKEFMYEKIRQAMLQALRKDSPNSADLAEVILDENTKTVEMVIHKTVVEQVEDPARDRKSVV